MIIIIDLEFGTCGHINFYKLIPGIVAELFPMIFLKKIK